MKINYKDNYKSRNLWNKHIEILHELMTVVDIKFKTRN